MTLPPVIRIFFAIDLPESSKQKIGAFITSLKKKSKSNAIRWTKPDNLHVTLHFLPEVKTEDLERLIQEVRTQIKDFLASVTLEFGEVILFPNPFRPRVIVLDILPQKELLRLVEYIGKGIKACSYEVETRPFHAHLTLGRIKHAHGINLDFLSDGSSAKFEKIKLNDIVLFRSEPQADGSKYTVLEVIDLSNDAAVLKTKIV